MGESEIVEVTNNVEGVAGGNEVEVADAEGTLPVVPGIVLIGEHRGQRSIFGGEGTRAVTSGIGTNDAEFDGIAAIVMLAQNSFSIGEGSGAPGGVGSEPIVFIE